MALSHPISSQNHLFYRRKLLFMKITPPLAFCAIAALSACQGSQQDRNTLSGFETPSRSGFISGDLENGFNKLAITRTNDQGDGFAYAAGPLEDGGIGAYSGVLPQTRAGVAPKSGIARFEGFYSTAVVTGIDVSGGFISARQGTSVGNISLRADFGEGTLRGTSDNGRLRVRGDLEGTNGLDGKVFFDDVIGNLTGKVSGREVIGAFNGNNADLIYAGGILAETE